MYPSLYTTFYCFRRRMPPDLCYSRSISSHSPSCFISAAVPSFGDTEAERARTATRSHKAVPQSYSPYTYRMISLVFPRGTLVPANLRERTRYWGHMRTRIQRSSRSHSHKDQVPVLHRETKHRSNSTEHSKRPTQTACTKVVSRSS